jgi:hypothetical protein
MAILLVLCCVTGQAAAAAKSPTKYWRITMKARVLQNCEGLLLVQFYNPDNMKIQDTDLVRPRYSFTIQPGMTWLDKDDKAIQPDDILAGQDIRLTFRYCVTDGLIDPGDALSVRLLEEQAANSISPLSLPTDTVVGTVIDKSGQTLTVYVEGGNLISEGVMARGTIRVDTKGATLQGAGGKPVTAANIQILDRVRLTFRGTEWRESFPPQFGGGVISALRLLEKGETLLPPMSLRATVVKNSYPTEFTDYRIVEQIRRYATTLTAGKGTTPMLDKSFEVSFIENGETVTYVFLSSGHARRVGSETWMMAEDGAYAFLERQFLKMLVAINF